MGLVFGSLQFQSWVLILEKVTIKINICLKDFFGDAYERICQGINIIKSLTNPTLFYGWLMVNFYLILKILYSLNRVYILKEIIIFNKI